MCALPRLFDAEASVWEGECWPRTLHLCPLEPHRTLGRPEAHQGKSMSWRGVGSLQPAMTQPSALPVYSGMEREGGEWAKSGWALPFWPVGLKHPSLGGRENPAGVFGLACLRSLPAPPHRSCSTCNYPFYRGERP